MDAIEAKIKQLIVEQLGVDVNEVTSTASFVDDLGADSLDTVELVMASEEEFDIIVPDEDAEQLITVGQAVEYVKKKLPERSQSAPELTRTPPNPPLDFK